MARGLLFDFDGTLYGDWRVWISIIEETLSSFHLSINPHEALERARSMIAADGGAKGTIRISNVAASLARDRGFNRDEDVRNRFFEILDARMDTSGPDRNLVTMLADLKQRGFQLGIVTFVRKNRITRRLDVWNFKQYFESVVTPDDVSDFKPSPLPFVTAMAQLRVRPSDCFVIGDEPVDMIGGKKAGAATVGLPQGFFTREELESAGADHILNSVIQLPTLVSK
ncbi:HAD family hydrolase [Candidatus Bathyarchaeota archaeon]|nr:HAD family hydrolase [Candidatus Bathyarchaeota archaeon]